MLIVNQTIILGISFSFKAKYAAELESQLDDIEEVRREEQLILPSNLDYLK